jgi:hypothetical protein
MTPWLQKQKSVDKPRILRFVASGFQASYRGLRAKSRSGLPSRITVQGTAPQLVGYPRRQPAGAIPFEPASAKIPPGSPGPTGQTRHFRLALA